MAPERQQLVKGRLDKGSQTRLIEQVPCLPHCLSLHNTDETSHGR